MRGKKLIDWLKKRKVGILSGGDSPERDVSLKSGIAVRNALRHSGILPVMIDPVGTPEEWFHKIASCDYVFIALHGTGGEDGCIQGLLELLNIPFSGSGVLASAIAMDKIVSKQLFKANNVPTPDWCVLTNSKQTVKRNFTFPVIIKPRNQGSAIGASIVQRATQLSSAVNKALKYSSEVLVEKYISGKELTVAVLGKTALPVVEVVPKGKFYDYRSKYETGMSRHIVPAHIPPGVQRQAKKIALKVHQVLGLRAVSRIDFRCDRDNRLFVLEANSIPGLTEVSLLPDAARAQGVDFDTLILRIIELSRGHFET
jgi:D-alanine-D-alanine ligase